MAETTVIAVEGGSLPHGYTLAPGEEWQPLSISVEFDGGGAAVDFLPAVAIYAQNGRLLSRSFPADSIGAGDSAEVTFAPFLRETGGAGGGIEFNTDNEGGWFELGSGASIPAGDLAPSGVGLKDTSSGGGVGIWDGDVGGGVTLLAGPTFVGAFGSGGLNLTASGGFSATLQSVNASVVIVAGGNASIQAAGDVNVQPTGDANILPGANIVTNLPLADPGVSGALWNNGGVVNVSP